MMAACWILEYHTTFLDVIRIVATGCDKGQMFVAVSHTHEWLHADTKRV